MTAAIIGVISSVLTILVFSFLKRIDKHIIYGLILMGIGFLYIGYTWTDINTAIVSFIQAMVFTTFAYLGIKKNYRFLMAGHLNSKLQQRHKFNINRFYTLINKTNRRDLGGKSQRTRRGSNCW